MWHDGPHGAPSFWALTHYADVARVNNDPTGFSSEKGGILMTLGAPETRHPVLFSASTNSMINLDANPHRQLRREHMPFFTAGYMRSLRERVAGEVTRLLDGMAGMGKCDLVHQFSEHLPVFTLCEIAQLQLEESYRQIFARFPDIAWTGEIDIAPNNFVHAIRRLEVAFTPA